MNKKIIFSLLGLSAISLSGCVQHQHKYSEDWSYNETMHWHDSTCGHEGMAEGLGEHNFVGNTRSDCGCTREIVYYNFNFVSDICDLNNEKSYELGTSVELTLTPHTGVSIPETIEVYIDGNAAKSGEDYTYDKLTGKISIEVNGNVLIRVMSGDGIGKYQITEQQLAAAKDFDNMPYFQSTLETYNYSDSNLIYIGREIQYGENVLHYTLYNLTALSFTGATSDFTDYYFTKDGESYTEYINNRQSGWEKEDINAQIYQDMKTVNVGMFVKIGEYEITFDKLNGHFDNLTCSYIVKFNSKDIDWEMRISFLDGKFKTIEYYGEDYRSYYGLMTFSYNEIAPIVPEEAINCGQSD